MGAHIETYINGRRKAITDYAFGAVVKEELLGENVLTYSITNNDSMRQYAVDPDAMYKADGQFYDTKGYRQNSGTDNCTTFTAYHVLLRSANYAIPIGYSFVGTIPAIVQDILNLSGANSEFTVGTCADITTTYSYSLGNTQISNAYSAIILLTKIGFEPKFDNFTVNVPVRWGSDTGKTFEFSRNLCSIDRTFDKTTTPWTYSVGVDMANLARIPGGSVSDNYETGDTVGVKDSILGDSIVGKRISTYEKCLDDASQDKAIIGDFVTKLEDMAIATDMKADTALNKAITSVQQGEKYSNVSIDHVNGFMAALQDGSVRVVMNGNDCFAVQVPDGDDWKTIQELTSEGLGATKLFTPGSNNYAVIGTNSEGYQGIFGYQGSTKYIDLFSGYDNNTFIQSNKDLVLLCGSGANIRFGKTNSSGGYNEYGITTASYPLGAGSITISNGIVEDVSQGTVFSGNITIGTITIHVYNGSITSVT